MCCEIQCFVVRSDVVTNETNTRRLLDLLLDGGLAAFVAERRARGEPWRTIARDVYQHTQVDITGETLRTWFAEDARRAS